MFLILEDGAIFNFAALIHGTLDQHVPGHVGVGVACDGLSEVSTKEGDLINRESCQHSPEIRQPPSGPIVVVRSMARSELTYSSQLQTLIACTFCISVSVMDRKSFSSPPYHWPPPG